LITNFLELRVERLDLDPTLRGVCAGFEAGKWRAEALSKYLIRDCLLDFALTRDEKQGIGAETAGRQLAEAAAWLYNTPNYKSRGEIGELLLHVAMCQFYGGRQVISKVYFKDAANDTVKGFDSVHVCGVGEKLELWLGEVKFYSEVGSAIADVTKELEKHLSFDYLKAEFIPIRRKLEASAEDEALILAMTDKNVSLDKVVTRICVPVLLTYDSETVGSATAVTDEFVVAFSQEVMPIYDEFVGKLPQVPVRVHLCLFPLGSKAALRDSFHQVLTACQTLN
jgi:hypothetical protein